MAYDVHGMLEAVHATIAATWTDVLPGNGGGGLYTLPQIEKLAFEDVAAEGFPFAVLELEPAASADWGLINAAWEALLTVYFVDKEALTEELVWDRLEALKSALFQGVYSGMAVLDIASQSVHPSNPILNFFLMRSVPYVAGSITMRILYGETAL
jgi:hypothetical protein